MSRSSSATAIRRLIATTIDVPSRGRWDQCRRDRMRRERLRRAISNRRFDDFAERVGVSDAVAAARLRDLVEHGLLVKQPYQEEGRRTRMEYRLTDQGRDLLPAVLALMQWGDRWLADPPDGPVALTHRGCGAAVEVDIRCSAGHDVPAREILATPQLNNVT